MEAQNLGCRPDVLRSRPEQDNKFGGRTRCCPASSGIHGESIESSMASGQRAKGARCFGGRPGTARGGSADDRLRETKVRSHHELSVAHVAETLGAVTASKERGGVLHVHRVAVLRVRQKRRTLRRVAWLRRLNDLREVRGRQARETEVAGQRSPHRLRTVVLGCGRARVRCRSRRRVDGCTAGREGVAPIRRGRVR